MKKQLVMFIAVVLIGFPGISSADDAPHQVAVFKLNRNIADYKDYVIMETALPIRHMENIEEVEIKPIKGFKSGLIAYATCVAPGHIVRIKLKYKDSSKTFYEQLFKRIKKKYGEPDEYRGDPFRIALSWKWSFTDTDNQRISMILQHNSMDMEEKRGNSIKMTMGTLIQEDIKCYKTKALDQRQKLRHRDWKILTPELSDWDLYVPR
jgi:hypothetical protein